MIIVHGFGEHCNRHLPLAISMLQQVNIHIFIYRKGYEVHMADFEGFGYSGGERVSGSVRNYHASLETLL